MSINNEEHVKQLESFVQNRNHESFDSLYSFVQKQLQQEKQFALLAKIYLYRAQAYFYRSDMAALVKFISENLAFVIKHAEQEDLLRFKNVRALVLDSLGFREGFYEQMIEIKEYGEAHQIESLIITANVNLGLSKGREEKWEEALVYFNKAYDITAPKKDDSQEYFNWHCLVMNNLLSTHLSMNNFEKAKAYLQLTNELRDNADLYEMFYRFNVLKYYLFKGDYDQTKEIMEQLRLEVETNPAKQQYHFSLLELELDFAQRTNDLVAQKEALQKLIAHQKKSKKDSMLQLLIQSAYKTKRHELMEVSQCDPLTKLLNRRGFVYQTEQLKRTSKACKYIACAVLDIDYFKQINDKYGHLAGDHVISQVADVLKKYEKEGFVCSRYGGDEFVLTFAENSETKIMEKIKALFEELQQTIFTYKETVIPVTVTMGVIYVMKNERCPVEKLLMLADEVMYNVKRNGRAYYVVKLIKPEEVTSCSNM